MKKPQDVLHFWFQEIPPEMQFTKSAELDQKIRDRFLDLHADIMTGKTEDWRKTPEGRLAEIIVLDQFSRNMFRDSGQAFASDDLALSLAQAAVLAGDDKKLPINQRAFLYMPFMHSEDKEMHKTAVDLFSQKGLENNLKFEILHKDIIDRFGRYPHRNQVLGRVSSVEEIEFLKQKNSSF